MIYCIWYPSGGFGHYINTILSVYGKDFKRPKNKVAFGSTGDLHQVDLVLKKYKHNPDEYQLPSVSPDTNYSVLIDNGINDESDRFKDFFRGQKIIKICYTDRSWPVVAQTAIIKAMTTDLSRELSLDENWPNCQDWAVREKYFLYLRDHFLRYKWRHDSECDTVSLDCFFNYESLAATLSKIGIVFDPFYDFHQSMLSANQKYFSGVIWAEKVLDALKTNQNMDLSRITSLWDQAVINYFIHKEFGIEIPANDYAHWFADTHEIKHLL